MSAFQHVSVSSAKGFQAHRCEPVNLGLGTEDDPRRYRFDNRQRPVFSLFQYTLAGEGLFQDPQGQAHRIGTGQGFLVNCPSDTRYRLPQNRTWNFLYITFVGDMARWHVEQIVSEFGPVLAMPSASPPIELLLHLFEEARAGRIPDKYTLSAQLYRFLMELHRQLALPQEPDGIRRAIRRMERDYGNTQLSLTALAREARLSRFHFVRQFHRATGLTPHAFLTKVRIDQATDLLLSTTRSIKEIGALAGFRNASYFCQAFRRRTGRVPGAIRRRRM